MLKRHGSWFMNVAAFFCNGDRARLTVAPRNLGIATQSPLSRRLVHTTSWSSGIASRILRAKEKASRQSGGGARLTRPGAWAVMRRSDERAPWWRRRTVDPRRSSALSPPLLNRRVKVREALTEIILGQDINDDINISDLNGRNKTSPSTPCNRVTFLSNGAEYFPAVLDAISRAQTEILVEMYWFASDRIGREIMTALSKASMNGVSVRVVIDSFGSLASDPHNFEMMRLAGCEVLEYNPVRWWAGRWAGLNRFNRRDHRKSLVVDRKMAFTGGLNFSDHWLPIEQGGDDWKDYMLRIEGPGAELFAQVTERMLPQLRDGHDDRGPNPVDLPVFRWDKRRKDVISDAVRMGRNMLRRNWTVDTAWYALARQSKLAGTVQVVTNDAWSDQGNIRRGYLRAIKASTSRIVIVNSYFLPDRRIRRALYNARKRGVKVTIMVPGKSDIRAIQHATRSMYEPMLKRGVTVMEWMSTMMHAKVAVIDGVCVIGTANLDHRSWLYNLEVIAVVHDPAFADRVVDRIRSEWDVSRGHARVVNLEEYRKRGWFDRITENFWYYFRRML